MTSDDKVLVSRDLLIDIAHGLRITHERGLAELRAVLAQPSDGALTNEPFCYTTPGMVEVAKAIKAGSGVGRIGARMVKDHRFCVPLHLSALAPATVMLPPAPELPEEPPFADDDSYMDAYHAARRMRTACAKAIEAAGLKVEQ